MLTVKFAAFIAFTISVIIIFSFFYYGMSTKGYASLDYNVPIAKTIISGEFLTLQSDNQYIYFPGSSHVILSGFLLLGVPLNFFGLLSWIILFVACKKLGDTFKLSGYFSFLFAFAICTTISVIRTVGDQSIDKWLCTWFITSVIFLERPKKSVAYALYLGLSLGMLIGTKYSGPLFFLALLPVYWRSFFSLFHPLRLAVSGVVFTTVGFFWYIRNFFLEGNPYYPANILFFKGYPNYTQQDWMLWKIPFEYPQGLLPLAYSFLSEYLFWVFSGFVLLWYLVSCYKQKKSLDKRISRIFILSITTGLACLMLPVTPAYHIELFHIISDMRYLYIFMAIMILGIFVLADIYKRHTEIAALALLNAIPLFSFLPYQPKLFIVSIAIAMLLYVKFPKVLERIYRF